MVLRKNQPPKGTLTMPYHHLTPSERQVISSMRRHGYAHGRIARALGRSQSTISRELKRNGDRDRPYNPHAGNIQYWMRRRRMDIRRKTDNAKLIALVEEKLREEWSPDEIGQWLRQIAHPKDKSMWISYETIYRYVRQDRANGGNLHKHLRHSNKRYSKRVRDACSMGKIKDRVGIEERPSIVDEQARLGDWEGDTIVGAGQQGAVATLVDRKSLFLVARKMDDRKAASLNEAVLTAMRNIPTHKIHTLTLDNGSEFAHFKTLEKAWGADVYFAHPYSPWERAINENTNGLLRQYIPKKSSFADLTQEKLHEFVEKLNNRPRKKLGYRTPREVFEKETLALGT
jgi:IS30 family transposase